MQLSQPYFAIFCMILSMISYQLSASFAKQLFSVLDPLSVTILRLFFAGIIVVCLFQSWKIVHRLKQLHWRDLILYSLSLGLMNILFYYSLSKISLGIAVGLEFIGPLTLALMSVKQRRDYIWVLFAIVGIIGLIPWQDSQNFSFLGALLALGAGFFWGCYIHFGQKIVQQSIGMHALSISICLSTVFFLPFGLWQNAPALLDISHWKMAIIIALLATAIPYTLDLYALKWINKMNYGIITSLSPVIATITGVIMLGEFLSLMQYVAIVCIICASIGVTVFGKKTP